MVAWTKSKLMDQKSNFSPFFWYAEWLRKLTNTFSASTSLLRDGRCVHDQDYIFISLSGCLEIWIIVNCSNKGKKILNDLIPYMSKSNTFHTFRWKNLSCKWVNLANDTCSCYLLAWRIYPCQYLYISCLLLRLWTNPSQHHHQLHITIILFQNRNSIIWLLIYL